MEKMDASSLLPTLQSDLTVAAIQMVSGEHVADNLQLATQLVAQACQQGAQFVVLPEHFSWFCPGKSHLFPHEVCGSGPVQDFLCQLARVHHIWLVGGSLLLHPHANSPHLLNQSITISPHGEVVSRYDKMHAFRFFQTQQSQAVVDEGAYLTTGQTIQACRTECLCFATGICYDLRFPELFRGQGVVDAIVLPSAFLYQTGRVHWHVLLRARAIENQCYVIAAAQGGVHTPSGVRTYGHAAIIDPWGEVLAEQHEAGPAVVCAQLQRQNLLMVRTRLPALSHRRFDMFPDFFEREPHMVAR